MDISLKLIYHITSLSNLSQILVSQGLLSDTERECQNLTHTNIAHAHIKDRRKQTDVPVAAKGVVADYVPFYFCPRSPMLYSIHRGAVGNYSQGQEHIIHLCAKLTEVVGGTVWCASTGHAVTPLSNFFDTEESFTDIDWDAVKNNAWGYPHHTHDADLKRRKQAEFLVYRFFPWELFIGIGVMTDAQQDAVEQCLQHIPHKPKVKTKREWYY